MTHDICQICGDPCDELVICDYCELKYCQDCEAVRTDDDDAPVNCCLRCADGDSSLAPENESEASDE